MCFLCDNPTNQKEFDDLVYLDCSDCENIKVLPDNLPNLKFLSIYNTNIEEVPSYASLESLYCFDTSIVSLPSLPKLRKLMAQHSNLTSIPNDYYRLEVMNINNTFVDTIPDTMISLRWLSAEDTDIQQLSSKLISLEWLSIANCNIETMPNEMLSLQYLNCSGTTISNINTSGYPMLRKLSCKGCSIDPFSFSNGLDVMT